MRPTIPFGSNYSPAADKLKGRVAADTAKLETENPAMRVPGDPLTASASGLDPDISPDAALFQVPRIKMARHMPEAMGGTITAANRSDHSGAIFTLTLPIP